MTMTTADRILAMARSGINRDAIAAILDATSDEIEQALHTPEVANALAVTSAGGGALAARVDTLEQVVVPPAASGGGVVNGVTISYAQTASGYNVAVLNKRSAATAQQLFGWTPKTRGDFAAAITANGDLGNISWDGDGGGHDIWLVGYPIAPGNPWVVITPAQFEADLATLTALPPWGDTTKVPFWMP